MTKVIANLLLATRLAIFQLWRMKLRALVAVLVIATPASAGLMFATKYIMEERTKTSAQVLGYDKYETRFQRWNIDQDNFADIDQKIKAIAGDETVSILTSPLGTARELQGSGREAEWILWGPQKGALPQTSRLVSGRWPQNSREVLVSDVAVRNGAASTGTVSLVVDAAPAQDYTIVGVGRTVIGERHSKFTSVLDDRVTAVGSVPTDRQRNLWLIPGKTLRQDQIKQIEALGVVAGVRKDVRATGEWPGVLFGVLPLTLLACLVVTQVFLHGLGRMRQSVNTIVQNGGSTSTALTYSLMQGFILGALAALLVVVVGLSTAAYVLSTPAPSTHPLQVELRSMPAGLMLGLAMLIVCCTAAMSTIAAATARQSNTSHQAKTYTAKQADFDLMVPPVSKRVKVLGALLVAGVSAGLVLRKVNHDFSDELDTSLFLVAMLCALGGVVAAIGVMHPVILHVMGRLREALYSRERIGPAVRQSLGAGSPIVGICAVVTVGSSLVAVLITLQGDPNLDRSGWTSHTLGTTQQKDYPNVVSQIKEHPQLRKSRLDTIYTLPGGNDSQNQASERTQLVQTDCQLRSGRKLSEQDYGCPSDLASGVRVAVAEDETLKALYRVSPTLLAKMHDGTALRLDYSETARADSEDEDRLQLVRFVPAASGKSSEDLVQNVEDLRVVTHLRDGLTRNIPDSYFYVMSAAWFKKESVPLAPSHVMLRSRTAPTPEEQAWMSQVTGSKNSNYNSFPARWPHYGYVRVYVTLALLLGVIISLSSFGLAGTLATMRTLGHGYWRRFRLVAAHCLFAGLVASVLASAMAAAIALAMWLPQALVRPNYLISFQVEYLWLLVVGLLIPASACLVALPVTWLWSRTGARSASTGITGSLKPVIGVFVLLVVLYGLRMIGVW